MRNTKNILLKTLAITIALTAGANADSCTDAKVNYFEVSGQLSEIANPTLKESCKMMSIKYTLTQNLINNCEDNELSYKHRQEFREQIQKCQSVGALPADEMMNLISKNIKG